MPSTSSTLTVATAAYLRYVAHLHKMRSTGSSADVAVHDLAEAYLSAFALLSPSPSDHTHLTLEEAASAVIERLKSLEDENKGIRADRDMLRIHLDEADHLLAEAQTHMQHMLEHHHTCDALLNDVFDYISTQDYTGDEELYELHDRVLEGISR